MKRNTSKCGHASICDGGNGRKRCTRCDAIVIPCTGDAHSNPYIDNCGACMPGWGWVAVQAQR